MAKPSAVERESDQRPDQRLAVFVHVQMCPKCLEPLVPDGIRARVTGLKGPVASRRKACRTTPKRGGVAESFMLSDAREIRHRRRHPMSTTHNHHSEPLWDVGKTASFLGVSTKWVYERASRGEIPCIHLGGCRRFDPAAIRHWLAHGGSRPSISGAPSVGTPR